ncbi:MAG: hypothetical protein IJO59_00260 [Clostridia bacterium]|nr:hypothetical protein [Clostridia bacterium]
MENVMLHLFNVSISTSWLIAAVLLLRFCFAKAPKYIRCLLWGIVGVRLLMPFSIESALSLLPTSQTIPDEIVYATVPSVNTGIFEVDQLVNPVIGENLAPQVGAGVNPVQVWLFIGGLVWAIGVLAMLCYALVSYLSVRRRVREAALFSDNVYRCDRVDSPFILGLFRPRIYLPSDMGEEDQRYVIAHEQAHLARRDHWWKPLGFALLAVYWFNPLLWVAYVLLCRDIELACDEKVLATCGEEQKKPYADALINCSVPRKRLTACPLAFGETGVKGRIKSVLHYKKPAFWVIVIALLACVAVAIGFLTVPQDEEHSTNYGIVGVSSGVDCENVLFHYREGSINHADPYITVTIKNDTDDTLCFGEYFTLYSRDGKPCPEIEPPIFADILHALLPGGETTKTYAIGAYDLSQNGHYRLETEVYLESAPETKYTAYVDFTIDRIYSFVGWQYAGEGVVYGNDKVPDAKYTDGTVPNVYITEDSVYLQIRKDGEWKEIGALTQDKLDRTRFDYALTEDWWDAGYSAKILRENNKHTVSYINADAKECYYLLEQQNGEIYLAIGRLSTIDWIFRLSPVGQTTLIGRPTSPPTGPLTVMDCIVDPESLGGYEGISFDCVGCQEQDGRLYMRVRWENRTDKTITFDPSFTLSHNGKNMFPPEGYGWDTVLYTVEPGGIFVETLDISACVAKGEYQLTKYFTFSPQTEQPIAFPMTLAFTLPETRKTTAIPQTTTSVPNRQSSFNATVLEVYNGSALVSVDEIISGGNVGDKASITTNVISATPAPALTKGMKIRVVYGGEVAETYPVQIGKVFAIYHLEEVTTSTTPSTTPATTTTTTATRPTLGTQTTRFGANDFRGDVEVELERTEYTVNETLYFSLINNTGEKFNYGERYFLFQQVGEEQWVIYPNTTGTYKSIAYVVQVDGVSKRNAINLSQYSLSVGQSYRVALQINGEWVLSNEFTVVEPGAATAPTTTVTTTTSQNQQAEIPGVIVNAGRFKYLLRSLGLKTTDVIPMSEFLQKYPIALPSGFAAMECRYRLPNENSPDPAKVEDGYVQCTKGNSTNSLRLYVGKTAYPATNIQYGPGGAKASYANGIEVIIYQNTSEYGSVDVGDFMVTFQKDGFYHRLLTTDMTLTELVTVLEELLGGKFSETATPTTTTTTKPSYNPQG